MKRKKIDILILVVSVLSFSVMSLSILLMPISDPEANRTDFFTIVIGIVFWTALTLGVLSQILICMRMKNVRKNQKLILPERRRVCGRRAYVSMSWWTDRINDCYEFIRLYLLCVSFSFLFCFLHALYLQWKNICFNF